MNAIKVRFMLASGATFDMTGTISHADVDLLLSDGVLSITASMEFEPRPLTKHLYTKALT